MTVETCGRTVTLERPPDRVMTVGSEAPTLVWAAGAADRIDALIGVLNPLGPVAVAFEGVPMVVPGEAPSKEVLLGQQPDLLLGYGLTAIPWEEVEALGIDQIVDSGQCDSPVDDGPTLDGDASFQQIYDNIERYGRIFGTEDAAARAVADYRARVTTIEQRFRTAPKRTAAVLRVYADHISAYGRASIGHAQLETLGLSNAFAEVEKRFVELNVEELLARDPDVLVLTHSYQVSADAAMQRLRETPGAEKLTAVREGHIITVDGSAIGGGTPPIDLLDDMADMLAGFG